MEEIKLDLNSPVENFYTEGESEQTNKHETDDGASYIENIMEIFTSHS